MLGKWLGTFRRGPAAGDLAGAGRPRLGAGSAPERGSGAVLILAFVVASGAAVTSLGLAMATWCSRLGRAVGLTVTAYVLIDRRLDVPGHGAVQPRPVRLVADHGQPVLRVVVHHHGLLPASVRRRRPCFALIASCTAASTESRHGPSRVAVR